MRDEKNVVISGKLSDRNGSKQIMVDKMWLADVDYSTIKTELPQKSANKNYYLVRPEKYFEESQSSMDDLLGGEKEVAPYLKGKTFVVFDLETTGLDVQHCMVVQLGSYKIVDGKIVETFNTLSYPGGDERDSRNLRQRRRLRAGVQGRRPRLFQVYPRRDACRTQRLRIRFADTFAACKGKRL